MKDTVTLKDAVEIVISLASDNILELDEASQDREILIPMREEQIEALRVVEDHFMNTFHNQ